VGAQRDQAADIFAFDTLIQNPDPAGGETGSWPQTSVGSVRRNPMIGREPKKHSKYENRCSIKRFQL
jgi:hypothetical protein